MSEAANRTLPDEVMEKAKHHILDTIAAMVSGIRTACRTRCYQVCAGLWRRKGFNSDRFECRCGPIEAALANGELAHSDETDDSHAPSGSHPGSSVVPAALAVGEQFHVNGTRFLRAVVLGYDVGTRVSMAFGSAAFQKLKRDLMLLSAISVPLQLRPARQA